MSASYEFEGKTKEEAVRKACEVLGVSEDQLEIEVLSYGSTGIFGLVGAKKAKIKVTLPEGRQVNTDEEKPATGDEAEAVAEIAKKTLEDIISFIVDDATVTVANHPDGIRLKIEASNSAILIGKHGRTLDALQYLVRKIVRKKKNTKLHVSFDVEGYREKRKASLTQLALRLGEKVKRSGKPATINSMSAYDRRIVHIALKDDTSVRTQSMGSGLFRKLVIFPQKKQK
ncbi:MAG: protein jag [Deltaproteobacteria bacterium]|nr:protein jag [Deltaproteobacteria bacterium]MBW2075570.1 protein jag [Deltaproteobacteria bacterium]RLB80700.1 MAG: RNA-binding protein [Deltaproteobacteria bacterium]